MLNKFGKKICAGVGAFMTVFGSNALISANEKAGLNVALNKSNVNRNSGDGYSRNGALLSWRTFLEALTFGGFLGYGYNKRKDYLTFLNNKRKEYLTSFDNFKKETEEKLNENENLSKTKELELKSGIEELKEELKNDRKISEQIFEFLETFVSRSFNDYLSRLQNWSSWSSFEAQYDFVPYVVKVPDYMDKWCDVFYQVLGVWDVSDHILGKSLKERFPDIGEEAWNFNLSEEKIKKISKSETLNGYSLSLLNEVNLCKSFWREGNNIFDIKSDLYKFNGGSNIEFGKNCKRVFSKVYLLDEGKGCYLCEGFIMKNGNCHDKGLVLRFTYGHLVDKKVEKK